MLTQEAFGSLTITADIPADTELPPQGVFLEVEVTNWHGIRHTDSRVMDDATVPAMVTLVMDDGSRMAVWPDGTIVRYADADDTGYSFVAPPRGGTIPNPYRR